MHIEEQILQKKEKVKELELYIKTFQESTAQLEEDVNAGNAQIDQRLAACESAVREATQSLKSMQKGLEKLYNSRNPPSDVSKVLQAVMTLLGYKTDWYSITRQIQSYSFKSDITNFRKDLVSEKTMAAIKVYVDDPEFNPEQVREANDAVGNLCQWVKAIYEYAKKYQSVKYVKNDLKSQEKA